MKRSVIKLIPGDGIGIDVVKEAVRVLKALAEKHGGSRAAALYAYRLGKVEPAEKLQKQATAILEKTVPNRVGFSKRMEHYYRSVRTMTGGK